MAELKFTATFDEAILDRIQKKLIQLKRPVTRQQANKLGKATVKEMKNLISKGISPIKGDGRFEAYRGSYKEQIAAKGYVTVAGRKESKKLRPVNLKLTGKFLKALKSKVERVKSGYSPVVGYFKTSEQKKEQGHREQQNNQGFRPTIPQESLGEVFASKIQQLVLKFLNRAVRDTARKK